MKSVKYILLISILLLGIVFLATLPGTMRKSKTEESTTASASSQTSEQSSVSLNTSVADGSSAIVVGGEPESSASSSSDGGEAAVDKNEWAFFLINQTHPLPDNYTFERKAVQGKFEMDARCADYMINMLADAKKAGVNLNIVSAYRSVEYQQTLLDNDTKKYEKQGYSHEEAVKMASQAVAIPGQSEHNAGICADILEAGNYSLTEDFEKTDEFKWLSENAAKYGFILRYPKGKEKITGIEYEPWHYRFVGPYYAQKIKDSGLCLEEYYEKEKGTN